MSIKIDLMPRYVAIGRLFKRLILGAGVLLVGTAAILALITVKSSQELAVTKTNLINVEAVAVKTETAVKNQQAAEATAAPLETFVQFVVDTGQTGAQRAALVDLVGRYISPNAVVSQIDLSDGQNAKITATLKTPDDYARFLLSLRAGSATRGGTLFAEDPRSYSVVPVNSLPGTGFTQYVQPLPTAQPQIVSYPIIMTVVGKLKDPIVLPVEPGTAVAVAPSVPRAPRASAPPEDTENTNKPPRKPSGGDEG